MIQLGYNKITEKPIKVDIFATGQLCCVGGTGSGKSIFVLYILYNILKYGKKENCKMELFICDFKKSGDFKGIAKNYAEFDEITELIEQYYEEFEKTKENSATDYNHPFDSYTAQPAICFDEFRSSLKLKEMLLYCDIYPIELPSRYSNKFACYNKVYIVSNWELEKQYSELQREDKESWQAFLRRIHKVIYYKDMNEIIEYPTVQAYLERKSEFRTIEENEENPFE